MRVAVTRSIRRLPVLAATLLTAAACADSPTSPAAADPEIGEPRLGIFAGTDSTFFFDLYDSRGWMVPDFGGPVLTADIPYRVTLRGTWSAWSVSHWWALQSNPQTCGAEMQPQFHSPGTRNGPVGLDADTRFASVSCQARSHNTSMRFSLNGSTWAHYEPVGGPVYNPAHVYEYHLVGAGHQFGIFNGDWAADNYGQLEVKLVPFSAADAVGHLDGYVVDASLPTGTENSLRAKLDEAASALAAGDTAAARGVLGAFLHFVAAQEGKKIPTPVAAVLQRRAAALLALID